MSNNLIGLGSINLPYYVAQYKGRIVAIKRDPDYQATIKLIQKSIPKLRSADPQDIFIFTKLADYGDASIQISEEIWSVIVEDVKVVEIYLEDAVDDDTPQDDPMVDRLAGVRFAPRKVNESTTVQQKSPHTDQVVEQSGTRSLEDISITVRTSSQILLKFDELAPSSTIKDVKLLIESSHAIPATLQHLDLFGTRLDDTARLVELGLTKNAIVNLNIDARKSLIYLRPIYLQNAPKPLQNVTIRLSVNRKWECLMLQKSGNLSSREFIQSICRTVDVTGYNMMQDSESKQGMSCIYWDGISLGEDEKHLQDQLASPAPGIETPESILSPENSVAVPVADVESYILGVLGSLQFSPGHSFSGSVIPQIISGSSSYIALRFLPQAEYENVAPLLISGLDNPLVIRMILVYKGLDVSEAVHWSMLYPSIHQGGAVWKEIVGTQGIRDFHQQPVVFEFTWMRIA